MLALTKTKTHIDLCHILAGVGIQAVNHFTAFFMMVLASAFWLAHWIILCPSGSGQGLGGVFGQKGV